MKALIISDDETFIGCIDSFFQKNNMDTIIYKWFLKALDNLQEIRPDIIIINTIDYPRHWKILLQYIKSGICGNDISVFLYNPNIMSEDEKAEIRALGVKGLIKELNDESLNFIIESLHKTSAIFTNPKTSAFIIGTVLSNQNSNICFEPDFCQEIIDLQEGMTSYLTYFCGKNYSTLPVTVSAIEDNKVNFEINYEKR